MRIWLLGVFLSLGLVRLLPGADYCAVTSDLIVLNSISINCPVSTGAVFLTYVSFDPPDGSPRKRQCIFKCDVGMMTDSLSYIRDKEKELAGKCDNLCIQNQCDDSKLLTLRDRQIRIPYKGDIISNANSGDDDYTRVICTLPEYANAANTQCQQQLSQAQPPETMTCFVKAPTPPPPPPPQAPPQAPPTNPTIGTYDPPPFNIPGFPIQVDIPPIPYKIPPPTTQAPLNPQPMPLPGQFPF